MGDFIRVDIPNETGEIDQTRLYNPKAIYGVTFLEKALCLQLAAARNQTPVQSWELPKPANAVPALIHPPAQCDTGDHEDDDIPI